MLDALSGICRDFDRHLASRLRVCVPAILAACVTSSCGSDSSSDSQLLNVTRPSVKATPTPAPTPAPSAADLLGTYEVKFCGFDDFVEPEFNELVRRLGDFCAKQNRELANAGRFQCGRDSCTLRSTSQSGGPDRTLNISLTASSAGSIGIQFSLVPTPVQIPDWDDDNLFSCMHPSIYATTRLRAREMLVSKAFEGKALCGSLPVSGGEK